MLAAAVTGFSPSPAAAQTKLLRFPDIAGDRVAFCYAGDIWAAPAKGGNATRLTTHPGLELFPKFSPDGKWIAFTGQYEGDEQVYVIPAEGGQPKQLTYYPARGPFFPRHGFDNQVMSWTPGSACAGRNSRCPHGNSTGLRGSVGVARDPTVRGKPRRLRHDGRGMQGVLFHSRPRQ